MKDSFEVKIEASLMPLTIEESDSLGGIIEELLELDNSLTFKIKYVGEINVGISLLQDHSVVFQKHRVYEPNEALAFKFIIPNKYKDISPKFIKMGEVSDLSEADSFEFFKSLVINDIISKLHNLLILSQIAHPGSLVLLGGDVYFDGQLYKGFISTNGIQRETLEYSKTIAWPNYKKIPILKVLGWFSSNNFSFDRHSNTKTERALNAFTYLFEDDKAILRLSYYGPY